MLKTLIILPKFLRWENGVLQLVSEQVGPSDQLDESLSPLCRVIAKYYHCDVDVWLLSAV